MYIVPLSTDPYQVFSITLPIDGDNIGLYLSCRYNTEGGFWYLSVSDRAKVMLIDSLPLLAGEYPAADILEPYRYLGLGSAAVVPTSGVVTGDVPDDKNLGTDFVLVWGDRAL